MTIIIFYVNIIACSGPLQEPTDVLQKEWDNKQSENYWHTRKRKYRKFSLYNLEII